MNIQSNVRMSEQQYDAERSKLARTKKEARDEAGIRWEQQLADLFYRSGWILEQLAKKEGFSIKHVSRLTQFGRFLAFWPNGQKAENYPRNLSENRFRTYWDRTEERGVGGRAGSNERIRFKQVLDMMREETALHAKPRPKIGQAIKEQFANGKWHSQSAMAEGLGTTQEHVAETMRVMGVHETYGCRRESKRVGQEPHYRIFPKDKTVSVKELAEKLAPIIKELREEGGKHIARSVPITCAQCATRLQRLLDEWAE